MRMVRRGLVVGRQPEMTPIWILTDVMDKRIAASLVKCYKRLAEGKT
jgi:hypothetical protein